VKAMEFPTYTFDTTMMNQYNRWRAVQTKINYQPVQLRFHDDMSDVSKRLWYAYLDYYYEDQKNGTTSSYTVTRDTYTERKDTGKWGMARPNTDSFFKSIQLYSIYGKKQFSEYTLVNPILTQFQHDSHDHSQSDVLENSMQIQYETVKYAQGTMTSSSNDGVTAGPTGFGDLHYDKTTSPDHIGNPVLDDKSSWEDLGNLKEDRMNIQNRSILKEVSNSSWANEHEEWQRPPKYYRDGYSPSNAKLVGEEVAKAKLNQQQHSFPDAKNTADKRMDKVVVKSETVGDTQSYNMGDIQEN